MKQAWPSCIYEKKMIVNKPFPSALIDLEREPRKMQLRAITIWTFDLNHSAITVWTFDFDIGLQNLECCQDLKSKNKLLIEIAPFKDSDLFIFCLG